MPHVLKYQGERVFEGAVDPYEWKDVAMGEEVVCLCFPEEPLGVALVVSTWTYRGLLELTMHTWSKSKRRYMR